MKTVETALGARTFYLDQVRSRFSVFDDGKSQCLPRRFIAFDVANFHLLEDGRVEQNSVGLVCAHDEPARSLGGTNIVVRPRYRHIQLESSSAAFLPCIPVPRVEIDSRR